MIGSKKVEKYFTKGLNICTNRIIYGDSFTHTDEEVEEIVLLLQTIAKASRELERAIYHSKA